jgi:hypothetical protein
VSIIHPFPSLDPLPVMPYQDDDDEFEEDDAA